MTAAQIIPIVTSILSTVIIGLVGWGYRSDRIAMKKEIDRNAQDITKNTERIAKLEDNFNDLKSGMPLVYVLREDYVAQMNRFEDKLNKLLYTKGGARADE